MPDTHQNRRRSRLRQSLHRAWQALWLGWDLYLFVVGYGMVFGLLGIAAALLPDVQSGIAESTSAALAPQWAAPDARHWFGTDRDGIDMMSPILRASGHSIWLALLATVWGASAGLCIATVFFFVWRERGYRMLDRLSGGAMAIPGFFVLVTLAAGHGAGFGETLFTLGGLCAVFVAGRAGRWYQELESRGDVIAARALGYPRRCLLSEHLFSRIWKRAAASAATLLPGVLIAEAALGFSGAGERINPASHRLGMLIGSGEKVMFDAPWLMIFPGLMLWMLAAVLVSFAWAVRRTLAEPIDDRIF